MSGPEIKGRSQLQHLICRQLLKYSENGSQPLGIQLREQNVCFEIPSYATKIFFLLKFEHKETKNKMCDKFLFQGRKTLSILVAAMRTKINICRTGVMTKLLLLDRFLNHLAHHLHQESDKLKKRGVQMRKLRRKTIFPPSSTYNPPPENFYLCRI